jgi:ABC-type molybdate transport system substrate-binding protein
MIRVRSVLHTTLRILATLAIAFDLTVAPAFATIFPPWSNGRNDPAIYKGLDFTVPDVDSLADFHGTIDDPKLVLFVGGNYFFAMAPLVAAFEHEHPEYRGRIFYLTLPPGLLVRAMSLHDTFTSGNLTLTAHPDLVAGGYKSVRAQVTAGRLLGPAIAYVSNDLTIMVPRGNPGHITSLLDLGRPGVRLAMPNPAFEGVARQIKSALKKAGGDALVKRVYETKVHNGETILTQIHHRQTPIFLMQGKVVAGVTWRSEAIFQEQIGQPIGNVDIPPQMNSRGIYGAAVVRGARHPEAGKLWLAFLRSPSALHIFESYGFKRTVATPKISS